MITLIGLGNTGNQIVDMLRQYPQYNVINIDAPGQIKPQKTPEEYEENCPTFKKLFKNIDDKIYLFLSASGMISGCTLKILEQLKDKEINVVCVHSDPVVLSRVGSLQQRLVSNVLQEYSRSGLINKVILIDNVKVEEFVVEAELHEYWTKINEIISFIFHTIMVFENTKPIMQSSFDTKKITNISTYAVMDENKNKKMLYDLANVTDEIYYFSSSKNSKSKNFLKEVKSTLANMDDNVSKKFAIYHSETQDTNTYMEISTHIVQQLKGE
jgi:hypothetical protein